VAYIASPLASAPPGCAACRRRRDQERFLNRQRSSSQRADSKPKDTSLGVSKREGGVATTWVARATLRQYLR